MLQGNPEDLKQLDITLTIFKRIYRHAASDYINDKPSKEEDNTLLIENIDFKGDSNESKGS